MSKILKNMYLIYNNTFILSPLILEFFKQYKNNQPNDILLSYLILPLVLNKKSRDSLKHSNIRSSLFTFTRKKENLFGLPKRVSEYKDITNNCLQYAVDNSKIEITDQLSVKLIDSQNDHKHANRDALKASGNFVKVIRTLKVTEIYMLLGIKQL